MLNYDQNNQSQPILIQLTKDNQCIINSLPYSNQIFNQNYHKYIPTKNNSQCLKNPNNVINKFSIEDLNLSLTPTDKKSNGHKKNLFQNKNENEDNLLLSFSNIFDVSKTSTNSIILNKNKLKEKLMFNNFDITPVNTIHELKNDNNTKTNTKKNLNQLFNNISGDKKTPLKFQKDQIQNKIKDDYLNYDIYNKNCGKMHKNSNLTETSDGDNKINLFNKYEMDNDISNLNINTNKANIYISPSTKKVNSKENINGFLPNNNNFNKSGEKKTISEFTIENLINIEIENPIKNNNENKINSNERKKILVNRANFKKLKLRSKKRTCSTINISNFNCFFNGIERTNSNDNIFQNDYDKTNFHNYIDMSNDKQKLISSTGNSNTNTVVHISNAKKNIKTNKKILIKEQGNISNNLQLKTDRIGANNLNLSLSNKSSCKKNSFISNKNKYSIAHQVKEKLKILLQKHKDYLSKNNSKNKCENKLKIKEVNSNYFSHKNLNSPVATRMSYSYKNFNINSNLMKNNNKILKKSKNKINNNCLFNKSNILKNCNDNKNIKKIFNKSTKNIANSQKTLNDCNHKKIIKSYFFKNNYPFPTERNSCINGLCPDYSNSLNDKNEMISFSQISNKSRNINMKNSQHLNKYNNFISNTSRLMNGASRHPAKIIQNFNFYNKKKNYRDNDLDIINHGLNLDNSENISIFANSIIE